MTPTLRLLGGTFALLGVTAVVSPVIAAGVAAVGWDEGFSRIYNRVFEILLAVWLIGRRRSLGLGDAKALGLVAGAARRQLAAGFAIGFVGLSAGLVFCHLAGGLVLGLRYPEPAKIAVKVLQGLGAAVLVGGFEEVIFRGVLLHRVSADFGARAGVVLTTVLYGAVHLLHPPRVHDFDALSGVRRTLTIFAPWADPGNLPTFAAMCAFGLVLAWARIRTGSLWTSMGIHAGWVGVFRVGRLFCRVRRRPLWVVGDGWPPLVGSATGAVAVVVTAVALFWYLRHARSRASAAR